MKVYLINPCGAKKTKSQNKDKSKMAKKKRKYTKRRKVLVKRKAVSKRRYKRNPSMMKGGIKKIFSKDSIMHIGGIGLGFIAGIKGQKYINEMDAVSKYRKFTGLIPFILGSFVALKGKAIMKSAGAGLASAGIYDLIVQNVPALQLAPLEGIDLDNDYSDYDDDYEDVNGLDIDMDGDSIDVDDVMGEDTIIVGEDDPVLVGEDADSPYEMI